MASTTGRWGVRLAAAAALLFGMGTASEAQTFAAVHAKKNYHSKKHFGPSEGSGNVEKGELRVALRRGSVQPFELTVIETPDDCSGHLMLRVRWDKEANTVDLYLEGPPNSLLPHPVVKRTEGVDFIPNPFFPEQQDIADGRYQLWLVGTSGPIEPFFYSGQTLDLLGGALDFPEGPPEGAIPVPFPTLFMFATPMFQPRADGSVKLRWSFPYDSAYRGDRPEFGHHVLTFPPPNLCGADPNALHRSTLRPYLSAPVPRQQARPWSDYIRGGLLFDVTVEPAEYPVEPPMSTLIGSYSGATSLGGGVPPGFTLDIAADFAGVAPPIRPWPGAEGNGCFNYTAPLHTTNLNVCAP